MSKKLTEQDFQNAAKELGCEVAAIKAVAEVESRGAGFLPDGRPVILFERHKFHKYSGGKFSASHPQISSKKRGGYKGGVAEWSRMDAATALDKEAAYKSASWGKFQIMGFNHEACGFPNVTLFVKAMFESEGEHLKAFIALIRDWGLADELRNKKWKEFAEAYNGPAYRDNLYDTKMAAAYRKYMKGSADKSDGIQQIASPLPADSEASDTVTAMSDASNQENAAQAGTEAQSAPSETKVEVVGGDVKVSTTEGIKPDEKIAIEKPAPKNFAKEIRNDIAAVTGGEVGIQGVREAAEGANFLGLSPRFWVWISIFAVVAGATYLIVKYLKFRSESQRDLELTKTLVNSNSTDVNKVVFASKEELEDFKARGYKIVYR